MAKLRCIKYVLSPRIFFFKKNALFSSCVKTVDSHVTILKKLMKDSTSQNTLFSTRVSEGLFVLGFERRVIVNQILTYWHNSDLFTVAPLLRSSAVLFSSSFLNFSTRVRQQNASISFCTAFLLLSAQILQCNVNSLATYYLRADRSMKGLGKAIGHLKQFAFTNRDVANRTAF